MAARRWYAHITGLALDALATITAYRWLTSDSTGAITSTAVTASRVVVSDANGLPSANGSLTANRQVYSSASGTLANNAALTQNRVVTADSNGLVVSHSAITASRALVSDANGLPTHATLTSANLENVAHTVSDTSSINLTLSSGTLSGVVEAGGVTTAMLANQAAAYVDCGNQANFTITSSSYQDAAAHGYTPRRSASRVMVIIEGFYGHSAGTTTITIRRGTTVIGAENTYGVSSAFSARVIDTGHSGSTQTWNLSVKNTSSAGNILYGRVSVVDVA